MAFGSLGSGISALRSFSKGMEVIGNNIANVNTVAFKASRIKYSETFNQVLQQSAPSPSDGRGSNVQASQIGLGVQVEGIVGMFHDGGLNATSQPTDLAIAGEGFFLVQDERNNNASYATRGGDFRIDDNGYLVTSSGMNVIGKFDGSIGFEVEVSSDGNWSFVPNQDSQSGTITPTKVGPIRLDYNRHQADVVNGTYDYDNPDVSRNSVMYTNDLIARDASGAAVWGSFDGTPGNAVYGSSSEPHRVGGFTFNDDGTEITGVTGWHAFMEQAVNDLVSLRNKSVQGEQGNLVTDSDIQQAVSSDFFHRLSGGHFNGANNGNITGTAVEELFNSGGIDFPDTINMVENVAAVMATFPADQVAAEKIIQQVRAENTPEMTGYTIDKTGRVSYSLSNGDEFVRGQIMVIDFNDKTALIREGSNLFSGFGAAGLKEETNSNPFGLQEAGSSGLGRIQQGALELSNVDLTNEFAQMITTQRGFQAGSRIITVSDEILQEVVNLKR